MKWIWGQSEANLESKGQIWNMKSQSKPIWTNLKSEVFTIFSYYQSEMNMKAI